MGEKQVCRDFLSLTSRQKWANSWDTWIHSSDAGKIPSSRPVIGQAADTSQSQACYWEFFLHHLSGSKCLNYLPTFGELWIVWFAQMCQSRSRSMRRALQGNVQHVPACAGRNWHLSKVVQQRSPGCGFTANSLPFNRNLKTAPNSVHSNCDRVLNRRSGMSTSAPCNV